MAVTKTRLVEVPEDLHPDVLRHLARAARVYAPIVRRERAEAAAAARQSLPEGDTEALAGLGVDGAFTDWLVASLMDLSFALEAGTDSLR